jgi:hypothetical protein
LKFYIDEFNVKLSILEASKFFDRINHFEKTIIEIRDKNDICALFLYKKENGPILTIFNGLIGQLGKAEYVLKNEVAKAFGKEFNENERSMHFLNNFELFNIFEKKIHKIASSIWH